jgi:Leu/Phe-tRNA-protein transferase|tara:strand:- start:332 stop:520 length:189 start_codon:yes stop_codon:yes gene_type:complete
MSQERAEILIQKMLGNMLNGEELEEFLKSLKDASQQDYYSVILERHFNKIIEDCKATKKTPE